MRALTSHSERGKVMAVVTGLAELLLIFGKNGKQILDRKWGWTINNLHLAKTYFPKVLLVPQQHRSQGKKSIQTQKPAHGGTILVTFL